ncbi:MAG: hypothetical protein ABSF90_27265 [Syntrophobacteraceae bacterium]|jgi:hypothetical protein
MSSVVVFPEVRLLNSDFIILLLSHLLLDNVAIYSDSTYEKAGSLENKDSLESGCLLGFKELAPQLPITPGDWTHFCSRKEGNSRSVEAFILDANNLARLCWKIS